MEEQTYDANVVKQLLGSVEQPAACASLFEASLEQRCHSLYQRAIAAEDRVRDLAGQCVRTEGIAAAAHRRAERAEYSAGLFFLITLAGSIIFSLLILLHWVGMIS